MEPVRLSVSDFVALINQTLSYAYDSVLIAGELANFRVSKHRWVYFDLKDESASVRCFGTVYALPGPLEDGMLLEVQGTPRLHPQFGFSVTFSAIRPVGEGSIKKAAQLLEAKLAREGLFAPERKRSLPYPPNSIGLITSAESAAYADFKKVLAGRWGGLDILLADVQVQGERAPGQLIRAIEWFNRLASPPEVLVLIRGGGSADDLAAFSVEPVVRAVSASRIPTMVAIGHEVDTSLAELAADQRASTPSNAAELLTPDRRAKTEELKNVVRRMQANMEERLADGRQALAEAHRTLIERLARRAHENRREIERYQTLLTALNPATALQRGFAIVRDQQGSLVRSVDIQPDTIIRISVANGSFDARVTDERNDDAR